jgi:hypothetical protein
MPMPGPCAAPGFGAWELFDCGRVPWLEVRMRRADNHDGKAWRARAEACRAIAATFDNPETRAKMFQLAIGYERMAEHADMRAAEHADIRASKTGQESRA